MTKELKGNSKRRISPTCLPGKAYGGGKGGFLKPWSRRRSKPSRLLGIFFRECLCSPLWLRAWDVALQQPRGRVVAKKPKESSMIRSPGCRSTIDDLRLLSRRVLRNLAASPERVKGEPSETFVFGGDSGDTRACEVPSWAMAGASEESKGVESLKNFERALGHVRNR